MTLASAILTQTQIDYLQAMYDARINQDQTTRGLWAPVYQQLFAYLNELEGSALENLDEQTYLWLAGARFINASEGPFGDLIRDYTIIQHRLRYGIDPTDAEMDGASNGIARAFLGQWLGYAPDGQSASPTGGSQPTIYEAGVFDAGPAASQVFNKGPEGQDAAGWAGTLLFANLGAPEFWQNLVLRSLDVPSQTGEYTIGDRSLTTADTGSYNAIAAAAALQEYSALGAIGSLTSWAVIWGTITGLYYQYANAGQVALLEGQTTAKFMELYGLSTANGEATPEIGSDIFGTLGSAIWTDLLKDAHYTVGSIGADIIGLTPAANGAYATDSSFWSWLPDPEAWTQAGDVINAGRGDDTVYGTTGSDILDGGEGQDRLIYLPAFWSGPFSEISVSFDAKGKFDSRAVIEKWTLSGILAGQDKDVAVNFDRIVFDYGVTQIADPSSPSGYREVTVPGAHLPSIEVLTPPDGVKDGETLVRSETVILHGDLTLVWGAEVEIDLGRSNVAFHQDIVDGSDATKGVYINLATGGVVGLGERTDVSGTLDWLGVLGGVLFTDTRITVLNGNEARGSDFSDVLVASAGTPASGEGYSALYGGQGNDLLVAAGWESHLFGGQDDDTFLIGSNAHVEDAQAGDTVNWGLNLYGGVKQWWAEGNTAYWAPFSTLLTAFPVIGSEILYTAAFFIDQVTMKFARYQLDESGNLLINLWGQTVNAVIKDYHIDLDTGLASGGVAVFETGRDGRSSQGDNAQSHLEQFLNLALKAGFGVGLHNFDPLVLDLDGDGYELTTEVNSRAYFEFDADGFGERAGWVRGEDGLLALDANANGQIDNVTELFGNQSVSGFAMLAAHDLNADGVIDASDAVFSQLRVWRDADQDGVTDAGELGTLAELGIVSIALANAAPAEATQIGGNTIARTGTFTRSDGSTGGIADVAFDISQTASRWLGDATISASAALLPQLRGFGEVKDLRVAMTGDATLEGLVSAFAAATTNDLATLEADAEAILYRWAGVAAVAADAIGTNGFDARKLAFLEAYTGHALMPRDGSGDPLLTNIAEMEALWADQVTRLTLRLVVQGPLADTFDGIGYNEGLDLLVADNATALGDLYGRLLEDLPADPAAALAEWQGWAPLLAAMADGMRRFDANLVREDYVAAQLLAAADGVDQPLSFAELAGALGLHNLRLGTAAGETLARGTAEGSALYLSGGGTDIVNGGGGQDVYIFGRTIGHVTINDEEARPAGDRIRFAFLAPGDVSLVRDGNDLLITVAATGETVRVTGQFAPVTPLGSDVLLSSDKGVEEIQFADGTIYEIPEIMSAVGTGSDGDDHMVGTMHSDVFLGGLGDDLLEGGDDADLYVIRAGEGDDVIRDVQTTPLLRAADLLIFGDGIAPSEIALARVNGGDDLLITIGAAGQSVLIEGQFAYSVLGYNHFLAPNSRIEAFAFRDHGDSWWIRDLQQRLIAQATTADDDETLGFGDDDTFGSSAGNDLLIGMDGVDTYHWGAGSGDDVIDEQARYIDVNVGLGGLSLTLGADTIVFGAGIALTNLVFSRLSVAPDLTIVLSATGETLTVANQFAGFQTGPLGAQWLDRIEWFQFDDGTRISWQDVLADVTSGDDGDDQLWGDLYQDTLAGGLGDDVLSGRGYADVYLFELGGGHDTIADDNHDILGVGFVTPDTSPDVLELGPGIAPGDISFERDGADVTLVIGEDGDRITLQGQDDYFHTGVFGAFAYNRIEEIRFDNGTVWTWQDLNSRILASETSSGDDEIQGFMMADRFEASAGDDVLSGGDSGDTYVFGAGSGDDVVQEGVSNVLYGDEDAVEFAPGILPGDVTVSRDGDDLILTLAATGDTLTIAGEFAYSAMYTWNDVELFRFANGTTWTKADVQQMLTTGTAGADHLIGFGSDDTLDGLAGDDILEGRDGSDTYRFGRGSGDDIIVESRGNTNLGEDDRLVFGVGVLPGDISYARDGDDLVITIIDTGETLRIAGQFAFSNWYAWNDIEHFDFANGSSLTDIQVSAALLGGTPGNDHLVGTFRSDLIDGGAGSDLLEGGDGADRYVFGLGYGQDEIRESLSNANLSEDDQLQFGAGIAFADLGFTRDGNDLLITVAGTTDSVTITGEFAYGSWYTWTDVDRFLLADGTAFTKVDIQNVLLAATAGNDHLVGFMTGDTLDGGAGNDVLQGGDGADTYVFGRGYGQDQIVEGVGEAILSENDTLQFGADIAWSDLVFSRSGDTLVIAIAGTSDSITIAGQFTTISDSSTATWWDVENFSFADGTVKTTADVMAATLNSTAGNDHLVGFYGNDTLAGGLGDDLLEGGRGNDLYRYDPGDGNDVISDFVAFWGSAGDRLLFGAGIAPADVTVRQSATLPGDMVLNIAGGGSVTLRNQVSGGGEWTLDLVEFANGTVWTRDQLANMMTAGAATSGDDVISGTAGTDVIFGGGGNDTLRGVGGNDRLDGGAGNDRLEGAGGNDAYLYTMGGGDDVVSDYAAVWGTFDIVELGAGLLAADLVVARSTTDSADMILSFTGVAGSITIDNQFMNKEWGIDQVKFADGTILTSADLDVHYLATMISEGADTITASYFSESINGLGGDDVIQGNGGDDRLDGGAGNDLLQGSSGNDTYVYALGGGNDVITQTGWHGAIDVVELGAGLAIADLVVSRSTANANHMVLSFAGQSGTLTINGQFADGDQAIDEVRFAAGQVLTAADLNNRYLAALETSGPDTINGSFMSETITGLGGDDVIHGGNGNDRLDGGAGNDLLEDTFGDDVFVYALGGGDDVISQTGWYGAIDALELGAGLTVADLVVTRSAANANNMVLSFTGQSGSLTINGQFANADLAIDEVRFAAGQVLSAADLNSRYLAAVATSGADTINGSYMAETISGLGGDDFLYGFAGNDRLDGGAGNDRLEDSFGDDVFVYALGGGDDVISQLGWYGAVDILELGAGISTADIGFRANPADLLDVIVTFAGGGSILIDDQLNTDKNIDQIKFVGGTTWTYATFLLEYAARQGGSGDDFIAGTSGADSLNGGAGNDTIRGQAGNDTLNGGDGDDLLLPETGVDAVNGGAGSDTVDVSAHTAAMTIDLALATNQANLGSAGVEIWTDVENVIAGSGNDTLYGTAAANRLAGRNGVDALYGRDGNDVLIGGTGNDTLDGGAGDDIFEIGVGDGTDAISGGDGNDSIVATAANVAILLAPLSSIEAIGAGGYSGVTISGSGAADSFNFSAVTLTGIARIDGLGGNDTLTGSAGADTIAGGAGDDTLSGGSGDDVFQYGAAGDGYDNVDGGGGTDTILATAANAWIGLRSLAGIEAIGSGGFSGVNIRGSTAADILSFAGVTLTGIVKIDGLDGNDVLTGSAAGDTLVGGIGNDQIAGGLGNDSIDGGAGTDTADYGAETGAWTINLAAASNQAQSGAETDTLIAIENVTGGGGADTITGSSVANVLIGGAGNDRIAGGGGNDTIQGGADSDVAVFAGLQASYSITTAGGSIQIVDNQTSTDGNDGTDTLSGVEVAEFKGGVQVGLSAPIVLDLDGDGVELVDRAGSAAHFDWNGDGIADATGWIGGGDGILVYDRDGDGTVSNARELSFLDDKAGARSDLDGLSAFDSDGDGLFSATDAAWADFRIWSDANLDGVADFGELATLADLGIASISLAGAATNRQWGWEDNIVVNNGSFVRADGSVSGLADVAFNYDPSRPAASGEGGWSAEQRTDGLLANDLWRSPAFHDPFHAARTFGVPATIGFAGDGPQGLEAFGDDKAESLTMTPIRPWITADMDVFSLL
jgi:Ca2+-binding RTX toxin-like protein